MAKFLIDYYETYSKSYEIEADSKEEAEEEVRYGIREGKLDPPENCTNSWFETEELESNISLQKELGHPACSSMKEEKPFPINLKTSCKRSINEELVDVWAELMGEKIEKIREKQATCEDPVKYLRLESYISGISASLAMLSCLEKGRFPKDYDRVLRKFKV